MKLVFTNTDLIRSLLTLAVAVGSCVPSVAGAQELAGTGHESIERFIGQNTVLVGWIDVAQVDLDGLQDFATTVGLESLPEMPRQVGEIRRALIQLDVTRVYWISSLAELPGGPRAVLIPVPDGGADKVAMFLKAAAHDGQSVTVVGDVVLAGEVSAVNALQETDSPAHQNLVHALSRSTGSHGVAAGASAEALRTIAALLNSPQSPGSDLSQPLARLLPSLQSVALHGQLPPTDVTLQIRMDSDEMASNLADLLNTRVATQLQAGGDVLRLTSEGADVALQKNSLESSADAARALLELLQPARDSAHRKTIMNQLKQFALGLHNFHDVHGRFPPQRLVSDDGKPLLSWRVLILPYLGHANLYHRFRLDEPWDSDHNMRLVAQMPPVFGSPTDPQELTAAGKTRFVAPLTDNSTFGRPGESTRIQDIIDGTSNTLMVVRASAEHAVIWTKPDDLVLTDDAPLFEQIAGDAAGFAACSCDGAAHYLGQHVTEENMRALVSIDGREIVEWP